MLSQGCEEDRDQVKQACDLETPYRSLETKKRGCRYSPCNIGGLVCIFIGESSPYTESAYIQCRTVRPHDGPNLQDSEE